MVSGLCTTEPVCLCPTNFKSNYSNEQNLIPPLLHSLVTAQKYRSEGWVDVISCHASWLVNLVSPEMTGNPPLKRADEKQFVAPPINNFVSLDHSKQLKFQGQTRIHVWSKAKEQADTVTRNIIHCLELISG